MARVLFSGLEPRAAQQLANLVATDGHEIHRGKNNAPIKDLLNANVVFIGGDPDQYLPMLRRVRAVDSTLCFVVIARFADTSEWLDALEAGATDYWAVPFELRQVRALIAAAITRRASTAENRVPGLSVRPARGDACRARQG